ncbi:MAG: serine/threonine-protein kinase [Planctomycetota bacterium]
MRRKQLRPRSLVGKYRIQGRLGEGGFATVYRAMDTIEGVTVALKVPHEHLLTEDLAGEFRREARLHAALDHPNILPVKNAEVVDGRLVVAYLAGDRSLAERMRRRMSLELFLRLAEQMLEAVAFAHQRRIMHLDLKPENFILFGDDRVRLSDFSIAKVARRTVHGSGSGTVGHMAPEQAMGRASFRADVFSLGLIYWQMLTGELPEWPFKWPLPGAAKLRRRVPAKFMAWLQKALQVEPHKRFVDGAQMLGGFRRLSPSVRGFATRQRQRRRRSNGNGKTNGETRRGWKQVRFRDCAREYRAAFGFDGHCRHCKGPVAMAMQCCPWCGEDHRAHAAKTRFPATCERCDRGRKRDWAYCAWCYGAGFAVVDERSYPDRRYAGKCGHCAGSLLPFSRYCPWCRRKVRKPWRVAAARSRCSKCKWSVAAEYWAHCPWCTAHL